MEYAHSFKSTSRERAVAVGTFVVGAALFIGISVFATDIGTNVTATGSVFATGTVVSTGVMVTYRNLQVGTTTPSNPLQFGAQFATSTYFAKSVGIGDVTFLGNNNLKLEGNLFATGTLQASNLMIAYRNLQVGTTSPSNPLNFGASFATSTYFAKFVGIGDATFFGANNLKVEGNIFATSSASISKNLYLFRNLAVATTSPSNTDAFGAQFATSTYFAKSVGIGDATFFGNNNLKVEGHIMATGTVSGGKLTVGTGNVASRLAFGTCSVNPPPLKPGTSSTTACTATGVTTTDKVVLMPPYLEWTTDGNVQGNLVFVAASTTANDTVRVQVGNTGTSSAVDGAASTWSWWAWQ